MTTHSLSLRGGQYGRRGNPSCLGDVGGVVCSVTEGQWISHGLCPRDDKGGVGAMCLSLREGSGARDAAIHRVSEDVGGYAVRLRRSSGSPRASPSR
ncbi:hypothetical protein N9H45_06795 [Opitutales bacterium]|nr:hypothetical protein [Opitutales bacterium]